LGKKILQIAYDPVLLGVQRRLMETSGYEVLSVLGDKSVEGMDISTLAVDVVLLDHSAAFETRWELVRRLKLSYPDLPVVALRRDALDEPVTLADHHASAQDPAEWLDTLAIALV
jgi:CheY-like chemotaxis protein